jgi:hypothetical protein
VAVARGCRVVPVAKRCIAAARNGGAAAARGRLIAFIDADSQIHPETFNRVAELLAREDVVAGTTGVTVDRWSPGIASVYVFIATFARVTGWDAGVVFCRRADFEAVGGYDERRRFAEDVAFLIALQRLGRKHGQRLVRARRATGTSRDARRRVGARHRHGSTSLGGHLMRLNTLLAIIAVVSIADGVIALVAPGPFMNLIWVNRTGPEGYLFVQGWGACLLALGVMAWVARGLSDPAARRLVALGSFVYFVTATVIWLLDALSVGWTVFSAVTFAGLVAFALASGYFRFMKPQSL